MSNFNNYKKFENVGIRSSNDTLIVMDSSNNNISLHSSDGGDDNVDTLSIKNIINKTPNMDLNLSSLNGNTINPVITINNTHSDCRIMTNLNVIGNVNIDNNLIIPSHDNSSLLSNTYGSIYYNTSENMYKGYTNKGWEPLGRLSKTKDATIHKNLNVNGNINLTNGEMIQTTGIGSFGSINCGVGIFTNLNISGNLNLPVGITSSRPSNPDPGTIRYNNETHRFEGYSGFDGGFWINLTADLPIFIELALCGGGGGGGDSQNGGGGGGAGGLVEASGYFPLNVPFILQIGGGGKNQPGSNQSGSAGHMTTLTSNGFDLKAYGGGFGGSFGTAANTTIDGTRNGGSGGGGAWTSESNGANTGAAAGLLGEVTTNNIVSDLEITKKGGDGSDYVSGSSIGGQGGGAGGTSTGDWALEGVMPVGKTSGVDLWYVSGGSLVWAKGGHGGRSSNPAGNSDAANNLYIGHGGAGSHQQPGNAGQNGDIGGAIISVPAGISISITSSNNNMESENIIVNGRTSYMFYDNRFRITTGENSGSFTIVFLRT